MVSKALLPLGVLVAVVMSLLVLLGVVLESWLLVAAASCALVSGCLLVSLDAWRRVRTLRTFVRAEIRQAAARQAKAARAVEPAEPAPGAAPEVIDAVGLLQAQYVGRLDRLQASVESLVDRGIADCSVDRSSAPTAARDDSAAESVTDPTR